jgi:hypothetical protein
LGYSLAIPSTGASPLVNSGSAASEGGLTLSANGQDLVLSGYNVAAGTAGVSSGSAPRAVATVDANGLYTLAGTTSSQFLGNNIRAGTTDGNGNFWAVGANSGVVCMGAGTPSVSTTSGNNRIIQDIGGNLYFSTGSGSTRGIYEVAGNPTSGLTTAVNLINASSLGTVSPYDFAFNSSMTLAYIADNDAYTTSSGVGGVEKWALVGGVWTFQYSLSDGAAKDGAVGLAVNFSGANPTIYATSASGTDLFDVVDTGSTATGTVLATAGADEAFRGLDFAPTPEPSTIALGGLGLATIGLITRRKKN